MVPYAVLLLFLGTNFLHLTLCHPAREEIKLPNVNDSSPLEINHNLNNKKVFGRTVSNFERSISYLDKTVREVESLINANSTLPRLTRGEILEIIENITKSDLLEAQQKLNNKSKERDQKAVMLVMPYTPGKSDEGEMQELFTKPPVTKIIGESVKVSEPRVKPTHKRRRRPTSQTTKGPQGAFYGEVFPEPLLDREIITKKPILKEEFSKPSIVTYLSTSTTTKEPEPEITTYRPIQELFPEKTKYIKGSPFTTTSKPLTISTEISVVINNSPRTEQPNYPKRRRRPSKHPQRYPNHKYPDEKESTTLKINEGLQIVESPKLETATTAKQTSFSFATVPPARPSKPHRFTTAKPFLSEVNLPDDLKSTFEDLDLHDSLNTHPLVYESEQSYAKPPPLNDNVKDILASIGVLPSTTTTTILPGISNVADTLSPDMKELLMSFGLLPDPNVKDNPESVKEEPIGVPTAEIRPESYVQFKPLPESGVARSEMEELLEQFGLGKRTKGLRRQKAVSTEKPPKILSDVPVIDEDILPDYVRGVASDLGLKTRNGKKIRTAAFEKTMEKNKVETPSTEKPSTERSSTKKPSTEKDHVMDPLETSYATQDELEKLNQLLDIIKELERLNGTATEEDLKKIDIKNLKDLVGSLNKDEFVPLDEQEWAPDPLNYDYGLSKNEVKRQENTTSVITESVVVVTPSATTTTTTTTTTEASNIKDLEDSFGGSSDTGVQATLPPPTQAPRTGFYYLLDWNSFFEIDDQKGKRVNLRLQPHVGDPKQFLSVTVP
ncbi:hypothetical protein ILUMI_24842 [Ignelater luminosus]|uniref:Uncharacterized protein n=1 Tax=Ignelater luminosus TaxID=2038154 RepID=A0A8K0G090_IGNLU|nr:hypothetical protein ILUMI_24842 [Ignelater luminosus]